MSIHYPLPRSTRRTDYEATEGQTVFGPADWIAFDTLDVRVRTKAPGSDYWLIALSGYTVSISPALKPTVTFSVGRPAGTTVRVEGRRVHPRTADVTRGATVLTAPLEREFDTMAAVLQELRRDIDDIVLPLDGLDDAVAAAEDARDASAGHASSASGYAGAANTAKTLAEAARDAAIAAAISGLVNVAALALVPAMTVDPTIKYLRTAGFGLPVDGGGGLLRRVASEPAHAGKVRSTDRYLPNGTVDAVNGGWWELYEKTITPKMFGYAGAGDEKQVVRDMCAYPHANVVDGQGLQFAATADATGMPGGYFGVVGLRSDTTYRNLKIDFSASPAYSYCVHARGTEGTARSASSGIAKGALSITMSSVVGIVAGGYVRIATDELYGGEPSATEQRGEIKRVASVVGSTVTFTEGAYDTYASGNNLRLIPLTMPRNITLEKCEFVGGGDGGSEYGGWFEYVDGLRIVDCYSDNIGLWHWDLRGCVNFFIGRSQGERADSDQSLGLNYWVVMSQCCQRGTISDTTGRRFRHVWTGGGNAGVNRFITINGGSAVECLDAGLDTHPACESWSISNLQISGKTGGPATRDGMMLEGANHMVSNCHVDGFTGAGIVVQTMAKAYHDATTITGCVVTSNETNVFGIFVENYKTSGNCHGVAISACVVRLVGSGSNGIQVQSQVASGTLDRVAITGCIINATKNGIYAFDSAGSVHVVVITGNAIVTSDSTNFYGVRIDGVTRVTFIGNDVQGGWAGFRGSNTTAIGTASNNNMAGYGAGGAIGTP